MAEADLLTRMFRAAAGTLVWLFGGERVPRAAEQPRERRTRALLHWLAARESLPEAAPVASTRTGASGLKWLLGSEPLPKADAAPGTPSMSWADLVGWLFRGDRLEPAAKVVAKRSGFWRWLLGRETLPATPAREEKQDAGK